MPKTLTHLQHDVIACILASNEEREPLVNSAAPYMRAFEGGFFPTMPFTLHTPVVNKLIMYVHQKNCYGKGVSKLEFTKRCRVITRTLVEITNFIILLQEQEYINAEYKRSATKMPPDGFQKYWRRYEQFYPNESDPIIFVKSISITPARKLYELREILMDGN
jgi:hypothetical protein